MNNIVTTSTNGGECLTRYSLFLVQVYSQVRQVSSTVPICQNPHTYFKNLERVKKMRSNLIILIMSFVFLLVGCIESSQKSANLPEDALRKIEVENEEREINVYGSHKVNEELVLIVFRGVMNNEDIWVADVHKEDGQWIAKEIVQMNGPFEGNGEIQTLIINDDFGYEVGYIESTVPINENLTVIEIDEIVDWKIWIKQSK